MNPDANLLFLLILCAIHASVISATSISISPQALNKSGDLVRIEWAGVESPSSLDWLGIYSPPDSSDDDFLGYKFLSSCFNWESGSCSIVLPIVNIRSSYQFRIFRWTKDEIDPHREYFDHNPLPGTKHLMAKSDELRIMAKGPEQIHLSFTDNVEEMRVMFIAEDGSERFVKYGRKMEMMDSEVRTDMKRYERSDMCESPANSSGWRDPGFIHDGVMKNLMSGKKYYYKVLCFFLFYSPLYVYI